MIAHPARNAAFATMLALALLLGGYAALSQDRPQRTPAPPAADQKKPESVVLTGLDILQNESTGNGSAKNIDVVDDQTTVHADQGRWNTKQRVAQLTGSLKMVDPKADGTGDRAEIFYAKSKRIVVLSGNVQITVKPKKEADAQAVGPAPVSVQNGTATVQEPQDQSDDSGSVRKRPALITCDRAEYHYAKDRKYAILTGRFKVVQKLPDKTRTLTADHAEWWGNDEKVLLHAPVHLEDTKGMNGDAKGDVTVYTTDGDERIIMPGGGKIVLPVEDEDEQEAKPAPPKPAAGGAKSPPAAPANPASPRVVNDGKT